MTAVALSGVMHRVGTNAGRVQRNKGATDFQLKSVKMSWVRSWLERNSSEGGGRHT